MFHRKQTATARRKSGGRAPSLTRTRTVQEGIVVASFLPMQYFPFSPYRVRLSQVVQRLGKQMRGQESPVGYTQLREVGVGGRCASMSCERDEIVNCCEKAACMAETTRELTSSGLAVRHGDAYLAHFLLCASDVLDLKPVNRAGCHPLALNISALTLATTILVVCRICNSQATHRSRAAVCL